MSIAPSFSACADRHKRGKAQPVDASIDGNATEGTNVTISVCSTAVDEVKGRSADCKRKLRLGVAICFFLSLQLEFQVGRSFPFGRFVQILSKKERNDSQRGKEQATNIHNVILRTHSTLCTCKGTPYMHSRK